MNEVVELKVSESKIHLCSRCYENDGQSCHYLTCNDYHGDYDCEAPFDEFIFWTGDYEIEDDGWDTFKIVHVSIPIVKLVNSIL